MLYDPKWMPKIDVPAPVITRKDLTVGETEALLWVRESLLDGTINMSHFVMGESLGSTSSSDSCGTAGCIAGWMTVHKMHVDGLDQVAVNAVAAEIDRTYSSEMDKVAAKYSQYVDELLERKKFYHLFFMSDYYPNRNKVNKHSGPTPEQGVKAIERFLEGAARPWDFLATERKTELNAFWR